MVKFLDKNSVPKKSEELSKKLDEISAQMIKGKEISIRALYELVETLKNLETYELYGNINPKLNSVIWVVKKYIHDIETNFGEDNKGFPKEGGTEILENIAKFLGIYIQTSLFRNRPRDAMGTLEDIINSYYELLHLSEKAYQDGLPDNKFVVF